MPFTTAVGRQARIVQGGDMVKRDNGTRCERKTHMRRMKSILIGIFGVLFLGGLVQAYADPVETDTKMRNVSGEIVWIDVKQGKLQLKSDANQRTQGIKEYRINQNETRVTDPSDKKFLVIKDLRVGQHITIQLIDDDGAIIARKIIADPMTEPVLQEVTGQIESLDVQAGTLIIEEKPLPNEGEKSRLSYFVFEPSGIVIMKSPSAQPVQLELRPGDLVKVAYVVKDGKRHAKSITLLSSVPETTSITTTTTTSSTVVR